MHTLFTLKYFVWKVYAVFDVKYLVKYFQIAPEKLPGEHCPEVAGLNVLFQHTSQSSPADAWGSLNLWLTPLSAAFMYQLSKRIWNHFTFDFQFRQLSKSISTKRGRFFNMFIPIIYLHFLSPASIRSTFHVIQ